MKPCSYNTPARTGTALRAAFIPQGKGQHCTWQSSSTAKGAPEAASYGFHTPTHPPGHQDPPRQSTHPAGGTCRSWGRPGKHRARRLQHLPVTEQGPDHGSARAWHFPGCPGSRRARWEVGRWLLQASGQRAQHAQCSLCSKHAATESKPLHFKGPGAATGTGTTLQSGRAPVRGASPARLPWIRSVKSFKDQGLCLCPHTV